MSAEPVEPDYETVCVACGGRGGWWTTIRHANGTDEKREKCCRCKGTGWEPSRVVQRVVKDGGAA